MLKFKDFISEIKKPTGELKKSCWKGYTAIGTKKKNGKTVPNCVPEEYISEKIEDIHGKVVGIDELSKHLNKTQLKSLLNHPWHRTYADAGDKPTAYRVSKNPRLENDFSVEAGHGQPRDKETFGDKEDVRHMVSFHFYKNKVHNVDLYHNYGDQKHPETGKKVWVWKRSHKE